MPNTDGIYFWDTEDSEWKNLGNVMGVKGDKGDTGNTPNITATGSVTEDGGNPSVTVTKTGTVDNPNLEFNFKNFKGEKGDPGPASTVPGPAGQDGSPGVTPNITANASVSDTTGTPEVTVTKTGTTENPTLNFAFSGLKGERGPQGVAGPASTVPGPAGRDGVDGTDGVTPTITARATVDNTSSTTPTVSVVKTGTDANPDFEFNFHGLRGLTGNTGSQGPQGVAGPAGRNGNKIFSGGYLINETGGGIGTVTVDSTMAEDMNVGDFFITTTTQGLGGTVLSKNGTTIRLHKIVSIKGNKGDPGERGSTGSTGPAGPTPNITATANYLYTGSDPQVTVQKTAIEGGSNFGFTFYNMKGQKGDNGVTPNITATAAVSGGTGTPVVTVNKSGTATNPNFSFSFNGLKGERGERGLTGSTGPTGPAGSPGVGVPTGGSNGQFLMKNSSTNYDTKWVTRHTVPTGGSMGYLLTKNSSTDGDYSWKPYRSVSYINLDGNLNPSYTVQVPGQIEDVRVLIKLTQLPTGYNSPLFLNKWVSIDNLWIPTLGHFSYTWSQSSNNITVNLLGWPSPGIIILPQDPNMPSDCEDWWDHSLESYLSQGVIGYESLYSGPSSMPYVLTGTQGQIKIISYLQ